MKFLIFYSTIENPSIGNHWIIENPTMGNDWIIENPSMGNHCIIENPSMGNHWIIENPTMGNHWIIENPMMGNHWIIENQTIGHHWIIENLSMRNHWFLENPSMGNHCIIENPSMGNHWITKLGIKKWVLQTSILSIIFLIFSLKPFFILDTVLVVLLEINLLHRILPSDSTIFSILTYPLQYIVPEMEQCFVSAVKSENNIQKQVPKKLGCYDFSGVMFFRYSMHSLRT